MSNKSSIQLVAVISEADIIDGNLRFTADIGEQSVFFEFENLLGNEGQKALSALLHGLGMMNLRELSQFIGRKVLLDVIQPAVAPGLSRSLTVLAARGLQ